MRSIKNILKGLFIKFKFYPNLCMKCSVRGKCCHYAFTFGGYNLLTRHACKYLNTETGLCRIYGDRFGINKNCHSLRKAYKNGLLHEKCEYLKIRPLKKKVKPKITCSMEDYPNDLSETDLNNWDVFSSSHRDFVKKYFNEQHNWYDFFMGLDRFFEWFRKFLIHRPKMRKTKKPKKIFKANENK